jgi:ubiquinone/menaquinone biosynthesis C-methylase UbiE
LTVYTGASNRWHEDYALGRPGWPPRVVELAEVPPGATVLELGAGTGKLTRLLLPRFRQVVAVEPDEGMRRLLGRHVPDAQLLAGRAEEIPLPDGSVDAVFCAEAFHLFDWEGALAEIARVLRPAGALMLLWNLPAGPTEPSIEAAERLLLERAPAGLPYDPVDLNTRRYADGEWRQALAESSFDELRELTVPNPQTVDREALLSFLASMGWLADLPDAERIPLLEQVRELLPAEQYRRRWETHVHWTRLRDQTKDRSEMPHARRPV